MMNKEFIRKSFKNRINFKETIKLLRIFKNCNGKSYEVLLKSLEKNGFKTKLGSDLFSLENGPENPRLKIFNKERFLLSVTIKGGF